MLDGEQNWVWKTFLKGIKSKNIFFSSGKIKIFLYLLVANAGKCGWLSKKIKKHFTGWATVIVFRFGESYVGVQFCSLHVLGDIKAWLATNDIFWKSLTRNGKQPVDWFNAKWSLRLLAIIYSNTSLKMNFSFIILWPIYVTGQMISVVNLGIFLLSHNDP